LEAAFYLFGYVILCLLCVQSIKMLFPVKNGDKKGYKDKRDSM